MPSLERILARERAEEAKFQKQAEKVKSAKAARKKAEQDLEDERLMAIGRMWKKAGLLATNLDADPVAMHEALLMLRERAERREVTEQAMRTSIEEQITALMREE